MKLLIFQCRKIGEREEIGMKLRNCMLLIMAFYLMLNLSACGNKGKEYVERAIALPEEINFVADVIIMEDGNLEIGGVNIDDSLIGIWESKDNGANWENVLDLSECIKGKNDLEGVQLTLTENLEGMVTVITEENLYFYHFNSDGTIKQIENNIVEKVMDYNINDLGYVAESTVFCRTQDEKYLLCDMTTGKINEFELPNETFISYCIEQGCVYILTNKGVKSCNLKGELKELGEASVKNLNQYVKTAKMGIDKGFSVSEKDGEMAIFFADQSEILCFKGEDSKTIINKTKTSLGRESVFLQKLYLLDNEEVLMLAQDNEESILSKFVLEEKKKGKKALTIYSLEDNMSVQELVHMYQKKHPTVDVELQIGISDETITREDAIKRLNSSLISENGPDIILFDGLPYEKYIEQGLLEDIKPFVETQAEEQHLFSKMLDTYSVGEKQYGVPLFFSVMSMTSVNQIGDMNTMQDFMSQVESCAKNGEKSVFEKWSFDQIVSMLYRLYVANSMNGTEEPDAKKIEEFYAAVKQLYEMEDMKEVEEAGKTFDNISLIPLPYNNCDAVIANDVQMSLDYIVLMNDIKKVELMRQNQIQNKLLIENNLLCVPMMSLGILSKSSNLEIAKEFISFALSDETQRQLDYAGLYVNEDVMKERLGELEAENFEIQTESGSERELQFKELSEDDVQKWLDDFENASCISEADWQLFRMIMEEVPKVAKGKQSEEAAAKEACRKMKLYLDE